MHVSMPPDSPPPDDARGPAPDEGGNVVDPGVLAERRAQRAEQAEQSASRRAADAQVLAAQLARERARLEAERDAARAEAAAAREGADVAIAEAAHVQAERDALRSALVQARAERDALLSDRVAGEEAAPATPRAPTATTVPAAGAGGAGGSGAAAASLPGAGRAGAGSPSVAAPARSQDLRRELAAARTATVPVPAQSAAPGALDPVPGLARERRLVAQRAAAAAARPPAPLPAAVVADRRGDRAAPVTALALERERSNRLQAQLDRSLAVQKELRRQLAALERAVRERVEAEARIEASLRRVREELDAANALAAARAAAAAGAAAPPATTADEAAAPAGPSGFPLPTAVPPGPPRAPAGTAAPAVPPPAEPPRAVAPPAPAEAPRESSAPADAPAEPPRAVAPPAPAEAPAAPAEAPAAAVSAPGARPAPASPVPPLRPPRVATLDPLRLSAARERLRAATPGGQEAQPLRPGPVAPWLAAALQRMLADEPETAGRLALALLPAQALPAERALRYDIQLAGQPVQRVDVEPRVVRIESRTAPRPQSALDLRLTGDLAGLGRLLYGRRRRLRRRPMRVRGSRRSLKELLRLARAPFGIRDLADSGVSLEPALALRLVALAIDPRATRGERFAIAHAPLGGGPVDAWLRIADGAPPAVLDAEPAEPVRLTLRCTRGAILPLLAGAAPPPGESGRADGEEAVLALLRSWIAATEHPPARDA